MGEFRAENVDLNLVEDSQDVADFISWLGRPRDVLGVDTETSGLHWWTGRIRLVQFGDCNSGWSIPWDEWRGLIREVFKRWDKPYVFHNNKFDIHWLEREGINIPVERVHDTRIMSHIIDPTISHGLKPLGVRYLDQRLDTGQDDLKISMTRNGWNWDTVPLDFNPYWSYAALDPVITVNLYEEFKDEVFSDYQYIYDLEIAADNAIRKMENKGVRIDVEYCQDKFDEISAYVDEMATWIKEEYNCGVSPNEVATGLLREGVLLTKRTETGAWCVDAEVLESLDHPLASAVLERRQAQKIANAYFKNLLEDRDGDLIHGDINPLAARTGRMSISRPALQQIPVRRGKVVRDAFIPHSGNLFIDVDFDQIEQRLIAHYAEEEGMINSFNEADNGDTDFFTLMTRTLFNDPTIMKSDTRRSFVKNAAYGKAYGSGVKKFAQTAKCSIEEAESFLSKYDESFPGVTRWQKYIQEVVEKRYKDEGIPWVKTFYGRRLLVEERKIYEALNYIIQGTAGDIFKSKMVALDQVGLLDYAVLPVHDELLFEVPADSAEEISHEIVEIMEDKETFQVPLLASSEIGETWGEVH